MPFGRVWIKCEWQKGITWEIFNVCSLMSSQATGVNCHVRCENHKMLGEKGSCSLSCRLEMCLFDSINHIKLQKWLSLKVISSTSCVLWCRKPHSKCLERFILMLFTAIQTLQFNSESCVRLLFCGKILISESIIGYCLLASQERERKIVWEEKGSSERAKICAQMFLLRGQKLQLAKFLKFAHLPLYYLENSQSNYWL